MPEAPEVAFIVESLQSFIGKKLYNIEWLKGRYVKHGPPKGYLKFTNMLPLTLQSITSHGKVLFFDFENNWRLTSHLGLMGWWYIEGNAPEWRPETKSALFNFGSKRLIFSDQLSYGTIKFENEQPFENNLALDIMNSKTTWKEFSKKLAPILSKKNDKTIEELLVDQELLISGIGNYLKSEILYAAKIAPSRLISNITDTEWKVIFLKSKYIAQKMLKALRISEEKYKKSFSVYRRDIDSHGNKVATYKNKAGRTTYWVPNIQT
jgi:endonuclease-8